MKEPPEKKLKISEMGTIEPLEDTEVIEPVEDIEVIGAEDEPTNEPGNFLLVFDTAFMVYSTTRQHM